MYLCLFLCIYVTLLCAVLFKDCFEIDLNYLSYWHLKNNNVNSEIHMQCDDASKTSSSSSAASSSLWSPCLWLNFVELGQMCDQLLSENAKIFVVISYAGEDW